MHGLCIMELIPAPWGLCLDRWAQSSGHGSLLFLQNLRGITDATGQAVESVRRPP